MNGMEIASLATGEMNVVNLIHSSYTGFTVTLMQPKEALLKTIHKLLSHTFIIIGAAELLALIYEVNELYETFVKMAFGFHTSMNQVIDLQNRENIAQMQALYAQMNPHFLYNTFLELMKMRYEYPRLLFKDIAEQVGYPYPYYLSKLFKQCTGLTSTEFERSQLYE